MFLVHNYFTLITQLYVAWIKYYMRNNLIEIPSGIGSRLAPPTPLHTANIRVLVSP